MLIVAHHDVAHFLARLVGFLQLGVQLSGLGHVQDGVGLDFVDLLLVILESHSLVMDFSHFPAQFVHVDLLASLALVQEDQITHLLVHGDVQVPLLPALLFAWVLCLLSGGLER